MKSIFCRIAIVSGFVLAAPSVMASTINATLRDDAIQLDTNSVAAGKVTFMITNASANLVHELVVLKPNLPEDQLPVKADGKVNESKLGNKGEVEDITPGKTKKLTLKLKPGNYVLVCNMPGHYKSGMRPAFTVN